MYLFRICLEVHVQNHILVMRLDIWNESRLHFDHNGLQLGFHRRWWQGSVHLSRGCKQSSLLLRPWRKIQRRLWGRVSHEQRDSADIFLGTGESLLSQIILDSTHACITAILKNVQVYSSPFKLFEPWSSYWWNRQMICLLHTVTSWQNQMHHPHFPCYERCWVHWAANDVCRNELEGDFTFVFNLCRIAFWSIETRTWMVCSGHLR